jgi:hypothetical protein
MKVKVANTAHSLSGGFSGTVQPGNGIGSYSNLFYLSATNELYLWTRNNSDSRWHLSKSTDGGATWSAFSLSLHSGTVTPYGVWWGNDVDRVWIAWQHTRPNDIGSGFDYNRAVYCVCYDGTNYRSPNQTVIGTTISSQAALPADAILFPQSDDNIKRSVTDVITGTADGRPRLLYYVYPNADESANHELWHARWTGSAWVHAKVCDEGPAWVTSPSESYPASAQFNRANTNEIATAVSSGGGKKEMQIFVTADNGATWNKTIDVTASSIADNVRPKYPHGMTTTLNSAAKTPHLFWMGNGTYPTFTSYQTVVKAYPAEYAYGAMVKVDLPGNADVVLKVRSGATITESETLNLFSTLGMEFVNIGLMRFNDSIVPAAMAQYVSAAWSRDWRAAERRLINIVDDGWPSWQKSGTSLETLVVSSSYHSENQISSIFAGKRTITGQDQHLISNNSPSPLALVIMRLDSSNRLQSLVYQNAFSTVTADAGIGTGWMMLAAVFQRNATNAIRTGETQKTLATSDQSINASGSTAPTAIGQPRSTLATSQFAGPIFLAMQGRSVVPKAYTDALHRAISNPGTFITVTP